MKIKKSDLLNKKEKNFIEVEQGSNKIKIDDLLSNKEISVTRKPGAKEAEDAYRNFVINKSYGTNIPVANTQTVKPQVNINAPVMNTQPVNKPVTQPVARPVIDPLDEDALRINMANNRTEPTAIMKAASFVGNNLYNNIVKPAGQAIDRQYEKLDDYNFGEKALYDAYMIAQENSQNAWDEETLRLQRLKNDYDKLLSYMTPEQKVQYSRLPENKKKDYLDGIMAQLQTSKGAARAEEIRNIQDKTNQNLQKIGLSFESGMGGFKTGLKGAYNLMRGADETVAKNASEYAFDELRPETKGALGVAMDLSNTVGNMAPSIALGLVGGPLGVGALGTAAMGVSSAGKGYDSAIGEGYTPEQAAAYGIASGVSEALLQKIAGALPGVSNAQGLVTRFLGKYGDDVLSKVVSNPSLRKALVTLLGNAASEGSEEGAQEIIDTFIRNAVLGEDNNINWKDVGYSALLGGMTGGAFALPGGVSTIVNRDNSIDTAQPTPETTQPAPEAVENTVDAVQNDVEIPVEVTEENTAAETEPIAEVEEEVIESKPITDAVKRTVKAVNPNAENSQQIYRQIMTNNGFGELVNKIDDVAGKLGIELRYYADNTNSEGYYENGVVGLNINNLRNTEDGIWKVFKHELTHFIEGTEGYGELSRNYGLSQMFTDYYNKGNYSFTDREGNELTGYAAFKEILKERYAKNGVNLTPEQIQQEAFAKFIEDSELFTNEESIRRLAVENPNLIQKIYRWIKDTIAKIRATPETKRLMELEKIYERALGQAARGEFKYNKKNTDRKFANSNKESYNDAKNNLNEGDFVEREKIQSDRWQWAEYNNDGKQISGSAGSLSKTEGNSVYGGLYTERGNGQAIYSENSRRNTLNDAERNALSNTVIVDKDNNPAEVYHFTPEMNFEEFNEGDTGFHFGTKEQANKRGLDLNSNTGRIFKAYLNIKKPINARYDISNWKPNAFSMYLYGEGVIDAKQLREIHELSSKGLGYNSPASVRLREILKEKGYDGVIYPNDIEGEGNSYMVFDDNQIIGRVITEYSPSEEQVGNGLFFNARKQYSFSTDSNGRQLTPEQREYFKDSKAVDTEGRLLALYHQTENEFTVFDTKHKGAGTNDNGTPFGIFLKSTNSDIGLRGKNQMALYADIKNPLTANNRDELTRKLKSLSPEYDAITEKHKMLDIEYKVKLETAERDLTNFIVEWRKNNPDASRKALYDVPEFNKLFEVEDILVEEWGEKADALSVEAKEILTKTLRDNGYDGVILKNDAGSFGRSTDAYIALDPQQVKNIDNAKPTNNPDIRYSFKDDGKLTKKAESYLHRNTNTLLNDFLEITETDKFADARTLKRDINTFAEASVRNGEVDRAEAEKLFDTLYWDALKVNTDVYDKYRPLAEKIKSVKLYGGGLGSLEGEYRRRYFNKVRLVTDPSATKIDGLYKELSESYPELFDPEITNIEDQVPAMAAAIDYIYNRETKLLDLVKNNDERYNVAKEEFMKSLDNFEQGIRDVIRYNDSKETREAEKAAIKAERKENAEKIPIDRQFTKKFYEDLTAAESKYEWLAKKEMLTPDDTSIMRQLSEGTIKWDEVERRADEFNINAIKKVYDAYNTKHQLELTEQEHRNDVLREYREEAESSISDSDSWKDKPAGAMYARETMERNIEDITKNGNNNNRRNEDAYWINKTYFKPVHENEAKSTRLKNELGAKVKALDLGTKAKYTVMIENEYTGTPVQTEVSESGLVQLYGEGLIDDNTLDSVGADKEKIHKAVKEFRDIYNQLIEMANETLIRNGYRPVGYIKNYFPHFTENKPDSTLGKIAAYFGIEIRADELPTDIAGLTHTFRPGKKWVSNFLRRRTNITDYDALKGFDRYINGVADVIFHTDDIQRLRALESAIRYKYSDEGTKKRIKEIERIKTLTAEERISRINDIIKANEVSHLPNLVTQLRNYTDNLAGKKSMSDRNWEHAMGRGLYNFTKKMENRVSANMVALNPGSWLTNFIPITQVSGIVKAENLARAIWDTSKGAAKKDGFSDRSDFLVNRKGSDTTFKTTTDKVQEKLTKPFEMIDSFTAEIVTRALYYDKMAEVKNEAEALEYANEMAARVMADRSKGAKPTAFNAQNPVAKLFTMFQVEVNNQYSYMFKDVPADLRKKGLASLAWAFVKMFLGAYLYNEVYEKYIGRRAAFDPIDIMASAIGDFTNPDVKKSQAVANAAADVVDELPFVSGILGGGRVPISSAFPDPWNTIEAGIGLLNGEMNSKKAAQQLGKELIKPAAYLVPPVGGGQVKKTLEGISTVAKGGEVTYDKEGNEKLKYPIEDKTPLKYLQAAAFGKSSLKEAQDYYNDGRPTLSVKQTQNYHKAVEAGINYNQYMAALQASKGAESDKDKDGKTIALSLAKNKKAAIDEAVKEFNLSKKQKELLYEANDVSEKVW